MPKLSHEALVHLVRAAPEVIVGLLRSELGLEVWAERVLSATALADIFVAER
jgi:hypothetical protein